MFNFKKPQAKIVEVETIANPANVITLTKAQIERYDKQLQASNPKVVTVEEIHDAFYTEVDRLLETCEVKHSLESEHIEIIKKNERLQKLGFSSNSLSEKARNEETRIDNLKTENDMKLQIIAAIEYFKVKYPQYKFLTKSSVIKLCNKYKLIYGPVANYIGDVPEKNIKDIENFSIKEKDAAYAMHMTHSMAFGSGTSRGSDCDFTEVKIERDKRERERAGMSNEMYIPDYNRSRIHISKKSFEIVAPAKDFNLDGMQLNGVKLVKKPIKVEDPIVLQPVRHGGLTHYLIVTAWGDEASDPSVLNVNHN